MSPGQPGASECAPDACDCRQEHAHVHAPQKAKATQRLQPYQWYYHASPGPAPHGTANNRSSSATADVHGGLGRAPVSRHMHGLGSKADIAFKGAVLGSAARKARSPRSFKGKFVSLDEGSGDHARQGFVDVASCNWGQHCNCCPVPGSGACEQAAAGVGQGSECALSLECIQEKSGKGSERCSSRGRTRTPCPLPSPRLWTEAGTGASTSPEASACQTPLLDIVLRGF